MNNQTIGLTKISLLFLLSFAYSTAILKITIDYGDSLRVKEFHQNNIIKAEGLKVNNFKHGKWKYYDDNGFITKVEVYKNGKKTKTFKGGK